jgi:hypothetical protein
MRQDSSGVLAFRRVVMLSCLILVPAAAIFGSAFPELVQTQLVDRLKSLAELMPHGEGEVSPVPDPRIAAAPPAISETAPAWNATEAVSAWQPAVTSPPPYPATAHQVEYSEGEPTLSPSPPASSLQVSLPEGGGDHFTEIQQRLREYGASHYALEAAGSQGELYRFACTMADPVGQARSFSATDRDPLQAMHHVMRDVEAWRGQAFAPTDRLRR